jgi:hypothetical protein
MGKRERRTFTEDFKREAVRLTETSGRTIARVWVLLVSWVALRAGVFSKALTYLGMVIGAAGLLAYIPALGQIGVVFGLGLIVWFAWLGIVMLRSSPSSAA